MKTALRVLEMSPTLAFTRPFSTLARISTKESLMRFKPNWPFVACVAGGLVVVIVSCTDVVDPRIAHPTQPRFVIGPLPHGITYSVGSQPNNDKPLYGAMPYASVG